MLKDVVALAYDGVGAFGLGVASEIFGFDRTADGLPGYDFAVAAERPGAIPTDTGFSVLVEHGLERLATADLVIALGWQRPEQDPPRAVVDALREAHARGARLMSQCSGAFVLAATGLLDGRTVATHWRYADLLAERYPGITVNRDVLYVDDDPFFSSAGTAAGIDTCLYIIRREQGASVANAIARRMVVPPHRDGGQAQFVPAPVPDVDDSSRLHGVLAWAQEHLGESLSVEELAARALMSPRSFARHFAAATGSSPHAWLLGQRLALAQQLLEESALPVEEIARRTGVGSAATLRHHFALRFGTSPQAYRRTFQARLAS